ncbi:MAG: thiamine pyrophosphate-binding protein [Alphaproteobacteria bacterium]|nr:thiamine pyrophosphate-binding protein [Alphaproteobacteria bacterium]
MRAANQLIHSIIAAGTDTIFSLSGNQIMAVYDAAIDHDITLVHTRHEGGAVYMADGYARSSGKIGVALVTAAPGFTNALGPLYAIRQTQTPMLVLSGDSPLAMDGKMPFQQLDQPQLSAPLVKDSWRVTNPNRLADDIAGAIALARSGRPGPVHISLPQDMLEDDAGLAKTFDDTAFSPEPMMLSNADLPSIMTAIGDAEKPLIITGPSLHPTQAPGVADHLMAALHIPVICMQSPRGMNDPALGKIKVILENADALILLDKDVDFTLASGDIDRLPAERVALIAAQAESIAHASTVLSGRLSWGCIGDPVTAAKALSEVTTVKGPKAWFNHVMKALDARPASPTAATGAGLTAHHLAEAISTHLDPMPLIVVDGGEVGQWAQSVLPRDSILTNGLSGAIGGSIPQAIGMALANPGRRVLAFMGDGTAGFYLSELDTARRMGLPITFIIANDQRWGRKSKYRSGFMALIAPSVARLMRPQAMIASPGDLALMPKKLTIWTSSLPPSRKPTEAASQA